MPRSQTEVIGDLHSFELDEEAPYSGRWNHLFELLEELDELQSKEVDSALMQVFERAGRLSFWLEDLARLNELDVSDAVVLAAHEKLLMSLNGPSQAYHKWAELGVICAKRPHLLDEFIHLAMDRIYYYWDATTVDAVWKVLYNEEGVLDWERLEQPCFHAGVKWLKEELSKHEDRIAAEIAQFEANA